MLLRTALLTALLCVVAFSSAFGTPKGELYAVLVAGSDGWYNYRHQADVAHAYHTLRNHSVKAENIIVMMYDDIANHIRNPYKGKLFNSPHGPNLYEGLKIDYRGGAVTPENFVAVLRGDKLGVKGGNGRVLESTSNDRVFVYFSDHGSQGIIAFPFGYVTAKMLNETLKDMHNNHKFGQLVFYLETCESGSMFQKILSNSINVYAVTAASPGESSYATYCNLHELPCLGDEFSVNWMENSDMVDTTTKTLKQQYETVRKLTSGSHVSRYGNLSIDMEPISWFQGNGKPISRVSKSTGKSEHRRVSWPSRDVEIMHLQQMKKLGHQSATVDAEISRIQKNRHNIETVFTNLVNSLVIAAPERRRLLTERSAIENLDCHDDVVQMFDSICIDINKYDYALKYMYVLNNLCNKFNDSAVIIRAMQTICPRTRSHFL